MNFDIRRIFLFQIKMTDEYLVNKNFDEVKNSSNNIILFGSVGNGKTTLINKLCKCNLLTKNDGFSCTRDAQYCRTPDGSIIIDFPGLNAAEDIVKHLKIQKSTLSVIPAKMICLVTKLTERYDDIIKALLQMARIFHENRNNLAIIITFCEKITITQEAEISKVIEKKIKIKTENIIFTSNKMSSETLLGKINGIKSRMNNIEKIQLKDRDLLNTVGNDGDIDVIEDRDKFLNEFKDSLEKFKEEFNKASENSLKFALYYAFVDYKEELIERFSNLIQNKVTDTDTAIVEIITFNNEIFNDFNGFTKQVQSALKAETANFDNGEHNNRYKKCPHCGTIWFKVKGCNSMPCGRRTKLRDIFLGRFKNYIVKFTHGIFKINTLSDASDKDAGKDSEFVGLTEEEKQLNLNRNGKSLIQPQGCGRQLDWTKMEDVTELINKKITEISMDSYDNKVKEKINSVKIDIFN
jgi:GTP-binding protein EngB required for normal cell division